MHPVAVEFYLEAIFCIDGIILVFFPDLFKNGCYINPIFQLDLVLGNKIIGVISAEGFHSFFAGSKMRQEERDADEGITAIILPEG